MTYEPLEIHLKRFDMMWSEWTGILIKSQKDINYHGNVVSSFVGKNVLSEADRAVIASSWNAIAKANKVQDQAQLRLQEIEKERNELIDLSKISKAKEFLREVNTETNETVDWVEKGYHYSYCTRCGETSDLQEFDIFLNDHSGCKSLY